MNNIVSKYKYVALALGFGLSMGLTSCSDSYMEEINTDNSKTQKADPGCLFTFALQTTYGNFAAMEAVRSYVAPYTQMYGGSWNTANAAGANYYDSSVSQSLWNEHYKNGIKNLVHAERVCTNDKVLQAAIRIHKIFLFDILTDVYGDIPATEAGLAYFENIVCPRYDEQKDVYAWFFQELDKSIEDLTGQVRSESLKAADITSMGGDVRMWLRYANALKMRLAMRISDADPELAKQKFCEAAAAGALQPSEAAFVKYLHMPFNFESSNADKDYRVNAFAEIMYGQDKTQPTGFGMTLYNMLKEEGDPRLLHYCRFMNENFRDNTDPNVGREDFTEEVVAATNEGKKGVQMVPTCWAWYDQNGTFGWPEVDCVTRTQHYADFIAGREGQVVDDYTYKTVRGSIATEFLLPETPGMLVSGAEVCFLMAEASVKGWIVEDAQTLYKEGIRAAMAHVHNEVYSPANHVANDEIDAYVSAHNLSSDPEKAKEQINTQAYFLHFGNPLEAWANLRRSDYPALYSRAQFGEGQNGWKDPDGGMELEQPVRLYYPQEEINYNKENYLEAIARMNGFSWHKRMWWDTHEQNYKEYTK